MNTELIKQYINPSMIIDIGANLGDSTMQFKSAFPEARIMAIEGNPYCVVEIQRLPFETKEALLSSHYGETHTFYTDPNDLYSKFNGFFPLIGNMRSITAWTVTLDSLKIHTNNYNLLVNIDVNGAELEVLEGGREVCENAEAIIITTHVEPFYDGFVSLEEVVKYMGSYGFVGTQDVDYYLNGHRIIRKSILFMNNLKLQK